MQPDRIAPYGLAALALGLIAAALAVVGGPGQGQMERRDDRRFNALLDFSFCIVLRNDESGTDAAVESCASDNPPPPGDAPFRFERMSEKKFRVCATFEDLSNHGLYLEDFDPQTGCLTRVLSD